jgi:uncharacterized membrane protein
MYAIWSTVFSLGKIALEVSPPLFLTGCRFLLAGVLFLSYLALRNRAAFKISYKQFFLIGALAIFGTYLTNAFEFWSLQRLTAAKTCFIYSLCPFFSAFFSYIHFKEKMNTRKWLGLAIGFAGIIPVLSMQKGAGELMSSLSFISLPEIVHTAEEIAPSFYGDGAYSGSYFRLGICGKQDFSVHECTKEDYLYKCTCWTDCLAIDYQGICISWMNVS